MAGISPGEAPLTMRRSLMPLVHGLLMALALALLLAVGWLGAPTQAIVDLLGYLAFSGLISLGASAAAVGWLRRGRARIWQQIALAPTVGVAIAIFNVLLTARLMFISADHDLGLLVLLLLFAGVIALALGYSLAHALAARVVALCMGARAISDGDLSARVRGDGSDELAELAQEFNRMAERLAQADHERRRAEGARRELLAAISHDLRTPLASVRAMVEALADGVVEDPPTVQRYLATMRGQIGHLSGLIDDLFELAQLDAGALAIVHERVAPGDIAEESVAGLLPQAEARGVQITADLGEGLPLVTCAPQKVARVFANLISNAIRHTPAGGSIVVRLRRDDGWLRCSVEDTGEGIAPDDLPHVFERFYRGEKSRSRATGGAGLGLAIARGIVEAHGGTIAIASERGRGTTVSFTLPLGQRER